jgi:hypothetical protein
MLSMSLLAETFGSAMADQTAGSCSH